MVKEYADQPLAQSTFWLSQTDPSSDVGGCFRTGAVSRAPPILFAPHAFQPLGRSLLYFDGTASPKAMIAQRMVPDFSAWNSEARRPVRYDDFLGWRARLPQIGRHCAEALPFTLDTGSAPQSQPRLFRAFDLLACCPQVEPELETWLALPILTHRLGANTPPLPCPCR